jgi:hypothetical protein
MVLIMGGTRMVMPVLHIAVVVFVLVLLTILVIITAISRPVAWGVSLLLSILLMLVAPHAVT